jgi:DNA replicative helicase MCM subunit Mcm2 (Cdc46/Mcm family)
MIDELKNKLRFAIGEELKDECQVVYILSRMRKILELEKHTRKKYKLLNIYCNWSLHAKIDKTEDIKDILDEFVKKAESRHHLLGFNDFKAHFKNFAKDILSVDLSSTYINKFVQILTAIISDTPISFTKSKIITITINPATLPRQENEITYMIIEGEN